MSQNKCWNGHGYHSGWKCPTCALLEEAREREERERKERKEQEQERVYRRNNEEWERRQREEEEREEAEREDDPEIVRNFFKEVFAVNKESVNFSGECRRIANLIRVGYCEDAEKELSSLVRQRNGVELGGDDKLLPDFLWFEIHSRNGLDWSGSLKNKLSEIGTSSSEKLIPSALKTLKSELGGEWTSRDTLKPLIDAHAKNLAEKVAADTKQDWWFAKTHDATEAILSWGALGLLIIILAVVPLLFVCGAVAAWAFYKVTLDEKKKKAFRDELARLRAIFFAED